ncbi:MAG: hypothetical protein INR71_00740 [Terriglobus roseus]|nr:hypothetical protein [Terriglobus roseus]
MGVPQLAKLLQPLGTTLDFRPGKRPDDTKPRAVFDGPALAHHVYYCLLARATRARHALEAVPSYHQVCSAVVDWLDTLRLQGVTMYASGLAPHSCKC